MKLSSRTYIIIGILVFIILLALLYLNYSKQISQRKTAEQNVASAQTDSNNLRNQKNSQETVLTQTQNQVASLQAQLNRVKQNLNETMQNLPLSADSTGYQELLFQTAEQFNVSLTGITAGDTGTKTIGKLTFSVTTFGLTLKGNTDDILNLLHALASEPPFQFTTIDQLSINTVTESVTETGPDGNPVQVPVTSQNVSVSLTVYGYSGG